MVLGLGRRAHRPRMKPGAGAPNSTLGSAIVPSGQSSTYTARARDLKSTQELAALLEKRAYSTYKARLKAAQRLASRNNAWNAWLISMSTSSVVASVAILVDDSIYGAAGDALLLIVAIVALVASLSVSVSNYSGRSRDMFLNYRKIQRLSSEAERVRMSPEVAPPGWIEEANRQYDALLDESENHTVGDHDAATGRGDGSIAARRDQIVTLLPYVGLAVPVALLIPFVSWFASSL